MQRVTSHIAKSFGPVFVSALAPVLIMVLASFSAPLSAEEGAGRFVASARDYRSHAIARYGPFQVVDASRAILVDVTDERTPSQFAAMLRDFPAIDTLALVECPGTFDDLANLRLGRMIRAAGIAVHVPRGGSVRSGAVELVMAGASVTIDDGSEFAVHAWIDDGGMEADDYAASAPENSKYLSYYREMGLADGQAASFYAMTNSVPNNQAKWLDADEMRGWLALAPQSREEPPQAERPKAELVEGFGGREDGPEDGSQPDLHGEPQLAHLDLGSGLN